MIRTAAILLALSCLALPTSTMARGGPRTLSDYNIQKESAGLRPHERRHFNGLVSRRKIGTRAPHRGYFPGVTHYPTIRLNRAHRR